MLDAAHETAARFHEHWRAEKKSLPLAKYVIEAVERQLKIVPLARTGIF